MALKVPIFIVISKVDLCTRATVERTVRQLERVLKQPGCNKVPMVVGSTDDAVTAAQQFAQSPRCDSRCTNPIWFVFLCCHICVSSVAHANNYNGCWKIGINFDVCLVLGSITPIFTLSSVTGESLDMLKVFFNIIPPLSNSKEQEELMQQLTEFQVSPTLLQMCNQLAAIHTLPLVHIYLIWFMTVGFSSGGWDLHSSRSGDSGRRHSVQVSLGRCFF